MKEFFLKIISAFDPRGANDAQKATGGLADSMREAAREGGIWGGVTASIGTALTNLAGTVISKAIDAIKGLGKIVADSVGEFAEAELKMTALDQALAQQGKLTDDYRERLSRLAGQLQATTAIADEKWLGVLTTLTKFGADTSNIDRYADAVKNLAGFLGGDIEQAAFLFGKAMTGSTEMLGRYGIEVDKSKTATEQLEQIMAQVATRGGGQLEAQAKTLSGQWASLKLATSDLMEGMGGLISKTGLLQASMQILGTAAKFWADIMGGTPDLIEGINNKLQQNKRTTEEVEGVTKTYTGQLDGMKLASKAAAEALDRQAKSVADLAAAEIKAAQARGDYQVAQLDANGIQGAERLKAEAEIRAAQRRQIREIEARQAAEQIELLQQQIQAAELAAHDRQKAYLDQLAKTEIAEDYARQQLKYQAQANGAIEAINKAKRELEEYEKSLVQNASSPMGPGNAAISAAAQQQIELLQAFIKKQEESLAIAKDFDKNAQANAETERQKLTILSQQNTELTAQQGKEIETAQRQIEDIKRRQTSAEELASITERTAQLKDLIAQRDALSAGLEKEKKTSADAVSKVSSDVAATASEEAKARERALAAINAQIAALSNPAANPQNQLAADLERLRRNAALNQSNPVSAEFYKEEIARVVAKMEAAGQSAEQTIANVSAATGTIAQGAQATSQAAQAQSQAANDQVAQITSQLQALRKSTEETLAAIAKAIAEIQQQSTTATQAVSANTELYKTQLGAVTAQLQAIASSAADTLQAVTQATGDGQQASEAATQLVQDTATMYRERLAQITAELQNVLESSASTLDSVSQATAQSQQASENAAQLVEENTSFYEGQIDQITLQLQAVLDSSNATLAAIAEATAASQSAAESSTAVITENAALNQEQISTITGQLQALVVTTNQTLASIASATAAGQQGSAAVNAAVAAHAQQLSAHFAGTAANINSLGGTVSEGFAKMSSAIIGTQNRLQNQINRLWDSVNALWNRA